LEEKEKQHAEQPQDITVKQSINKAVRLAKELGNERLMKITSDVET
jgi:hypothetical protein